MKDFFEDVLQSLKIRVSYPVETFRTSQCFSVIDCGLTAVEQIDFTVVKTCFKVAAALPAKSLSIRKQQPGRENSRKVLFVRAQHRRTLTKTQFLNFSNDLSITGLTSYSTQLSLPSNWFQLCISIIRHK